jgi:hypothetical protein
MLALPYQFGFLSLRQAQDYRQSELSCKVVKSRIYKDFARQIIQFSGQTKIYGIMAKAGAFRGGARSKADSEFTQGYSTARLSERQLHKSAACLRARYCSC